MYPKLKSLFIDPNEYLLRQECDKLDKTSYYISHDDLKKLIENQ